MVQALFARLKFNFSTKYPDSLNGTGREGKSANFGIFTRFPKTGQNTIY